MNSGTPTESGVQPHSLRHRNAWLLMSAVVAVHVLDEALTDFLSFYNPLVVALRERLGWFPAPTFSFGGWLLGLALLVVGLIALAPVIREGRAASYVLTHALAVIMFLNGAAHLGGSIYFRQWLPGATTAPLLLLASVLLMWAGVSRRLAGGG